MITRTRLSLGALSWQQGLSGFEEAITEMLHVLSRLCHQRILIANVLGVIGWRDEKMSQKIGDSIVFWEIPSKSR